MGTAHYTSLIIILLLFISGCVSIPRIIVLNDPLTAEEHLSLGLSYELNGEYDPAIQEYRKAFKKDKKDYRPLFYLGNAYYKKKEYEQAERYYHKALRVVPNHGDIHNNLAWVYLDTGRFEAARGEIEMAFEIRRDPYYLDTLAHIYVKMGKNEEAAGVLQEALAMTPSADVGLLYNEYKLLGELYEKLGKEELAREAREKAERYRKDIQ